MNKKRAKEILLAHACCSLSDSCNECPWNNMYDCEITKFDEETIKKAIKIVKGSNMKMMKLQDIKLTSAFVESVPSKRKMDECRYYWDNYHKQDRYLVVNRDGYLIDGYVMYCVLKENNVEKANVKISLKRKKRWLRKNTKDLDAPHYRNEETTYVYGMHYNTIREEFSNEFVWRVPKSWSEQGWEDAHDSWRNCHEVKDIFRETIEFNDTYCYPISIGAMQILIKKLSDELQKVDFNKMDEVDDYNVNKLLCAIEDLTKIINDAMWDYSQGIEYEYRVYDSF